MRAVSAETIIEVDDLTRRFGDFVAVKSVTFDVKVGEIFGYLGANGAGKSTTIRMLCGLLGPSEGKAMVAGHDIATDAESVKASIGYMSQKFSLYLDLPVQENAEFFAGAYGLSRNAAKKRIETVLNVLDLGTLREAITGALPGGTRQRLALGCALLHEPKLIFLDEPTAGVDPASRRQFWQLIRKLAEGGTTVFVTTHYMDEAEYCDRIGLMVAGRLIALDTPAALKRDLVPGRMLLVQGSGIARALPELSKLPNVIEAKPFGASAHVRLEAADTSEEQSIDAVTKALLEAGAKDVAAEVIEPSLEDVFLSVVHEDAANNGGEKGDDG